MAKIRQVFPDLGVGEPQEPSQMAAAGRLMAGAYQLLQLA
jgi:hypothetical protein